MKAAKVLGVGWAKTGTTSLGRALRILGYHHKTRDLPLTPLLRSDRDRILDIAKDYNSFEDWPWLLLYREFDARFPGTRFILTERDSDAWLASYRKHLARGNTGEERTEWRRILYDLPFPDVSDDQLVERYERHNRDVKAYFSDRPHDLLVVDWSKGHGWDELAAFLEEETPDRPFPHANTAPRGNVALFRTPARIARKLGRYVGLK